MSSSGNVWAVNCIQHICNNANHKSPIYGLFRISVLTNDGKYTIFEFNNQRIRFITSDKLERYTKIVEWDNGYLVVMAKYKEMPEVEEYIDLIPILNMLYYDTETFLKPIKEVRIDAA